MYNVLVIDDELAILDNMKFVLELDDYNVLTASSGIDGISLFKEHMHSVDTVITDMKMPGVSGMDVLKKVKSLSPEMSIIVLTGHGDMENAILAMKEGAFEYLLKPVDTDMLIISLRNAINKKEILLENINMHKEILYKNEYLQKIHDSAEKILLNMLPKELPKIENFKFSTRYKSCDTVGGDMFDVLDMEKYLCFYVFDVSSHGILASVITIILKSFIQNLKYNFTHGLSELNFSEAVSELNKVMNVNTSNEVFATLFIGFVDYETKKLYYISAGHIKQFIFNDNHILSLNSTGTILGVFENAVFECKIIQLSPGDKILLFTDGVTEVSKNDKLFGENNLLQIIKSSQLHEIDFIVNNILEEINTYSTGEQTDDITMLGIEIE